MTLAATSLADVGKRDWRAVVVGAGPAGAIMARELARQGVEVLLIDRASFPRSKICGGCLNGAALAAFEKVGLANLPDQLGAVRLSQVRIACAGRSAAIPLRSGMAISRESLDSALVKAACSAGVRFVPRITATRFDNLSSPELLVLTCRDDLGLEHCIKTRALIIAQGLNGRLGTGEHLPVASTSRIGAGCQLNVAHSQYGAGTIWMAVGRGGYVGLVRLKSGQLDVAAAFDPAFVRSSGGLGRAAAAIIGSAGLPMIGDLATANWRGTPSLTREKRQVAGPGWFAVGDAAGYVEPFTGEGMAWAMTSAIALAPIVARASATAEQEWERAYRMLVRKRQVICRISAAVLRSPRLSGLGVRLLATAPFLSRPVVEALNRSVRFSPGIAR